jgi:hypothetical protein
MGRTSVTNRQFDSHNARRIGIERSRNDHDAIDADLTKGSEAIGRLCGRTAHGEAVDELVAQLLGCSPMTSRSSRGSTRHLALRTPPTSSCAPAVTDRPPSTTPSRIRLGAASGLAGSGRLCGT